MNFWGDCVGVPLLLLGECMGEVEGEGEPREHVSSFRVRSPGEPGSSWWILQQTEKKC